MILTGQIVEITPERFILLLESNDRFFEYNKNLLEKLLFQEKNYGEELNDVRIYSPLKNKELKIKTKGNSLEEEYMGCFVRVSVNINKFGFDKIKGYNLYLKKIEKIKPTF